MDHTSEKNTETNTLEKRLWKAAEPLRDNSGLYSAEYKTLVLGFLEKDNPKARGADPKSFVDESILQSIKVLRQRALAKIAAGYFVSIAH